MSVDTTGRLVLTEEACRSCGTDSGYMHPAGVIANSNWTCTRCGRRQHDVVVVEPNATTTEHLEGID